MEVTIKDRFAGCIIGGAIGDAFGSIHENQPDLNSNPSMFYPFGKPLPRSAPEWRITDDTQLTLLTCEAIIDSGRVNPECIAQAFLAAFTAGKLSGLGASTLKALRELAVGGHWSQVGRKGEYAAGNGAAMRIAPLAFLGGELNRKEIEEVSKLTHQNDEAYAGALSVVVALRLIIQQRWTGSENLFALIIDQLPDTRVRDRIMELANIQTAATVREIGKTYGSGGYVVESVPLALFAASKITRLGFEQILDELVALGGDTDTNCAIAGQVAGTLVGIQGIPQSLKSKLMNVSEYSWVQQTIDQFIRINYGA